VLVGTANQLEVPDELTGFIEHAERSHKTLFYGYPAVVLTERKDRQNKLRRTLAPLFMQQLEVHQDAGRWSVTPLGPILPHPALVLRSLVHGEAEDFISSFEPSWAADERSQFVREIRQRLAELGLTEMEPLQPDKLSVDLRLQPPVTGARNVALLFEAPEGSAATAGLVTDLKAIIDQRDGINATALGTLSGGAASPASDGCSIVAPFALNEAQEAVIRSAMTRRLTVATGPPGTGKSQLVANLVATAVAANHSVLVASTNNKAVDEVVWRCDSIMPGLALRTGNEAERQREADALDRLLAWQGDRLDLATSWHTLRLRTEDVGRVRSSLHDQATVEAELATLVRQRETQAKAVGFSGGLPPELAADEGLRTWFARTKWANGSRLLGFWLRRWLASRLKLPDATQETCRRLQDFLETEVRWRVRRARATRFPDDAQLLEQTRSVRARFAEASGGVVRATLVELSRRGRQPITRRLHAVRAREGGWSEFLAAHAYLRGWAVTTHSIRRFPPRPALFDLAIVDEASQCSIPAVAPVLFRAKRALIIGDPMQLTHVTTMTANTEAECRTRAGIRAEWLEQRRFAYRRHSAFRAFDEAAGQTVLLDEHFRCHPTIAEISNRMLYGRQLTILTDVSRLRRIDEKPLTWQPGLGVAQRPPGGSWRNREEAQHVAKLVRRLLERLPPEATVGVVTPFRAQQELLSEMCEGTNARVGTVHTFQGGECDVMVLSVVGERSMPDSGLRWLRGELNLWNVAITRARSHLIIVGDLEFWRGRPGVVGTLADVAGADDQATSLRMSPGTAEAGHAAADMLHRRLEKMHPPMEYRRDAVRDGYSCDFLFSPSSEPVALLMDYGHGEQDPARHLRLQLELCDRLAGTGVHHASRVAAWRALWDPDKVLHGLRR
jgi:hypothetical protein